MNKFVLVLIFLVGGAFAPLKAQNVAQNLNNVGQINWFNDLRGGCTWLWNPLTATITAPCLSGGGGGGGSIAYGGSLPLTCAVTGELFQLTSTPIQHQLYACTSSNTWTQINELIKIASVREYGCYGDGIHDDTTCLTNWMNYLNTNPGTGGYIPQGKYLMNGELRLTASTFIYGDGWESSFLVETNPTSDLFVAASNNVGNGLSAGPIFSNFSFSGQGVTTTGNLTIILCINSNWTNVAWVGTAGRAIQVEAERTHLNSPHISDVRQSIAFDDTNAINETYINNFMIFQSGYAKDDVGTSGSSASYCFSINCVSGVLPSSGSFIQDQHFAIETGSNTDNITISYGSLKPTTYQGGIRSRGCTGVCSIDHIYVEGYNPNSINPGFEYGGPNEGAIGSNSITNSQTIFDINDGKWFRPYASNVLDISDYQTPSQFVIRPPDYIQNSTAASSLGGGILKGNYEIVGFTGVLHDQTGTGWHMYVAGGRGLQSTTAYNWPAGFIVEEGWQGPDATHSTPAYPNSWNIRLAHLNSVNVFSPTVTVNANPNTGYTAGEIVLGKVPGLVISNSSIQADLFFTPGSSNIQGSGRGILDSGEIDAFCANGVVGGNIDAYQLTSIDVRGDMNSGEFLQNGGNFLSSGTLKIGTQLCGGVTREVFTGGINSTIFFGNNNESFQASGATSSSVSGLAIVPYGNYPQFSESALVVPNVNGYGIDIGSCGACATLASGSEQWIWDYNMTENGLTGTKNGTPEFTFSLDGILSAVSLNLSNALTANYVTGNSWIQSSGYMAASYGFVVPNTPPVFYPSSGFDVFQSIGANTPCLRNSSNFGPSPDTGGGGFGNFYCAITTQVLQEITFSTTPVFNFSSSTAQELVLTGNVTSSTTVSNTLGKVLQSQVHICQDGTGGRTFVWPTNVFHVGFTPTIPTGSNQCLGEIWQTYDGGTTYYAIGGGGSSSGFANPMTTTGDIIQATSGGTATRLGAGTIGYVLTSNGPGNPISWQASSATISSVSINSGTPFTPTAGNINLIIPPITNTGNGGVGVSGTNPLVLQRWENVNKQTGTTYTVQSSDCGGRVVLTNNTSSTAVGVPQPGTSGIFNNCEMTIENNSDVTVTITLASASFNNASYTGVGATITLAGNSGNPYHWVHLDNDNTGANWYGEQN